MSDASNYARSIELKNGLAVTIRAIRSDDKQRLREAFAKLEPSTIYTRFFGYKKQLTDAELAQGTEIEFWSTPAFRQALAFPGCGAGRGPVVTQLSEL
jgi:hypothetical protein